MIVDLLVGSLLDLLTAILEAIPDASLPAVASTALEDFATQIGGALGGLDSLLPISEAAVFVGWVLGTIVPIFVAFNFSFWAYRNAPVIGGNG